MSKASTWAQKLNELNNAKNKSNRYIFWTALALCIGGTFFMAATGSAMLIQSLWGAVTLTVASFIVDMFVFQHSTEKGFKTFFVTGLYTELDEELRTKLAEEYLSTHENLNALKNNPIAKNILAEEIKQYCINKNIAKNTLKPDDKKTIRHAFIKKLAKELAIQHKYYSESPNDHVDEQNEKILPLAFIREYHTQFNNDTYKSNRSTKSWLLTAALVGAFVAGFAFFSMIAVECLEFFAIVSLLNPWAYPILGAAALVGIFQGFLFFDSLKSWVINGFSPLINALYEPVYDNQHALMLRKTISHNILKWSLMIVLLPLSLASLYFTKNTVMNSTKTLVNMAFDVIKSPFTTRSKHLAIVRGVHMLIDLGIKSSMWLVWLPAQAYFGFKHVTGACQKLARSIEQGTDWLSTTSFSEKCTCPHKTLFYLCAYPIVFIALLLHVLPEASVQSNASLPGSITQTCFEICTHGNIISNNVEKLSNKWYSETVINHNNYFSGDDGTIEMQFEAYIPSGAFAAAA